jgi:hypothetical protein
MLPIFDAHVRAEALTATVIERLTYFNVRTVLVAAHAPHRFETSEDLLAYFSELASDELVRISRRGSRHTSRWESPRALPRRIMSWRLPVALADRPSLPSASCVWNRPIMPRKPFWLQLDLARELGLPVLVTSGAQKRARRVRSIVTLVQDSGLSPEQVLIKLRLYLPAPSAGRGVLGGLTGARNICRWRRLELLRRYGRVPRMGSFDIGLARGAQDPGVAEDGLGLSDAGFRRLI